ncbi:unnamed protein product [Gongylonema pulchrum]|uniref:CCT-theta n=1 Tax=Gongylonema pulchrum TaxID=637853 RepID=A0A183DTJ0_9BILA|nr:unnamed protein product [Gongylonema pulchrum]
MNKMIINHIEKLFVTSDAGTILNELEVQHPAAKMLVMASQMQEKQIGDGTNTVVIFAASLLEHASELLSMGLNPREIADGYEQAAEKALAILPSLVVRKAEDLRDVVAVQKYLRSAVMSKQYANVDFITNLVAKACVQIVPANAQNFNVDSIRGLNPREIADGYEQAAEKALAILPSLVVKKAEDLRDVVAVQKYLRSAVMSKQYANVDFITNLVAKACVQIVPANAQNFNVDSIRVCKILGGGVQASRTMNGMVFERGTEGELKKVEKAKIVVYSCPFELTQTETKGTVLMETADELLKFSAGEEAEVEKLIKALADNGVNVVVSAGKFGDIHLHFMNKYKMMGVRLVSKFDLRRLCRSTGAQAQARVCCPPATAYGECDRVYIEEVGGKELTVFDKASERGNIATIVIRGSSQSRMDDVERAINDAVNTYKALTRDSNLLAGAGAAEIELARQIESFGEKWAGLEQYSIKKFAHALETLPKQVAENAGLDVRNLFCSSFFLAQENNNFLRRRLRFFRKFMRRTRKIIMSKQAKGPAPRAPKAADEADED